MQGPSPTQNGYYAPGFHRDHPDNVPVLSLHFLLSGGVTSDKGSGNPGIDTDRSTELDDLPAMDKRRMDGTGEPGNAG